MSGLMRPPGKSASFWNQSQGREIDDHFCPLGDMKLVTIANTWKMNLNFGIVLDSDFDLIWNDPINFWGLRSIFDFYLSSIKQLVPKLKFFEFTKVPFHAYQRLLVVKLEKIKKTKNWRFYVDSEISLLGQIRSKVDTKR